VLKLACECDECGRSKADANHWWIVRRDGKSVAIEPLPEDVTLWPPQTQHFCGAGCVLRAVQRAMDALGTPLKALPPEPVTGQTS
jgi:hypothetical protein